MSRASRLSALILANDSKFPDVTHVTASHVLALQPPVTFVDCRSVAERSVSVIPGALDRDAFEASALPAGSTVVCYCTIGYRSSLFAGRLKAERADLDVVNLSGSILSWAAEGGALVDEDGRPTKRLHVFGDEWDVAPTEFEAVKFEAGGGLREMARVFLEVARDKMRMIRKLFLG